MRRFSPWPISSWLPLYMCVCAHECVCWREHTTHNRLSTPVPLTHCHEMGRYQKVHRPFRSLFFFWWGGICWVRQCLKHFIITTNGEKKHMGGCSFSTFSFCEKFFQQNNHYAHTRSRVEWFMGSKHTTNTDASSYRYNSVSKLSCHSKKTTRVPYFVSLPSSIPCGTYISIYLYLYLPMESSIHSKNNSGKFIILW